MLEQAGFEVEHWQNTTAAGWDWFIEMIRRFQEIGAPPVSFVLLMRPEFKEMAANQGPDRAGLW